jgi:hypothetical protein
MSAVAWSFPTWKKDLPALKDQLLQARQIKQGMMPELLTGRVRLV